MPVNGKMKKQREPINRFKDVPEMNVCLKEWQAQLNLSDWIFYPVMGDHLDECNMAQNNFSPVHKSGKITIRRPVDPNWETCIVKCPDELSVVHELLHAKILYPDGDGSPKDYIFELHYHQAIEDIAKTLVATKYGLPISWFDNTKLDSELYPEKKEVEGT